MLQHMQLDWKTFGNSDAIKIFDKYLYEAYIFVFCAFSKWNHCCCFFFHHLNIIRIAFCSSFISFVVFVILAGIIFVTFECRNIVLDIVAPMNKSRPRKAEMDFQLFLDEERYFFLYLTHEMVGVLIGVSSIITTGTFLATIGKHFCASYKIARLIAPRSIVFINEVPLLT